MDCFINLVNPKGVFVLNLQYSHLYIQDPTRITIGVILIGKPIITYTMVQWFLLDGPLLLGHSIF